MKMAHRLVMMLSHECMFVNVHRRMGTHPLS